MDIVLHSSLLGSMDMPLADYRQLIQRNSASALKTVAEEVAAVATADAAVAAADDLIDLKSEG